MLSMRKKGVSEIGKVVIGDAAQTILPPTGFKLCPSFSYLSQVSTQLMDLYGSS